MFDIPVVSITSDGAKTNRRFYRLCQQDRRGLPYKTSNPYNSSRELFFFCDVPHLLKTARNCFSNSFAHSMSRMMQVELCSKWHINLVELLNSQKNGQTITWKWIEHLFLLESSTDAPGVRLACKLTRDHVWLTSFTRMRVYLAAQVSIHCTSFSKQPA